MSLFAIAAWAGTLSTLALIWMSRHDIAIEYRIWKLNRSIPDAVPIPEAEPVPARWRDKPWPNTRAMDSREIPEPMARAALEALTEGPRLRRVK